MSLAISLPGRGPSGGLSVRDRRALSFLVLGVALILALYYGVFPFWDAATDSSRALAVREKTLHKYRVLVHALPDHESGATTLAAALEESEKGLLSGATPALQGAEVQQQVRDLANASGIQLRSVDFIAPKNFSDDYALVGVSTQFAGPIDQVMSFLTALQSSPRILGVDHLRISAANTPASGKDPGKKQVSVAIFISGVAKAAPVVAAGESGK
jgi:type II secretory pathway component PulM